MKVLGTNGDKYICEVSHTEIEKFLNKYYREMKRLSPGDSVDLGKGYDWCQDTLYALGKTKEFIESNKKIIETITEGFSVLGEFSNDDEKEAP